MSPPEDDPLPSKSPRTVGERIGDWARRFGTLVADAAGRPTIPENLREPLTEARALRLAGDIPGALAKLRELVAAHPQEQLAHFELAQTLLHDLLAGGRPLRALEEATQALDETIGLGAIRLLRGAALLYGDAPERALDELRRAPSELTRLPSPVDAEAKFLLHVLAGVAHLRTGQEDRALREFRKARARMPESAGHQLRSRVLALGVELALAAGQVSDAESWVRDAMAHTPEDLRPLDLMCRVLAAKGDRVGAHALFETLCPTDLPPEALPVGGPSAGALGSGSLEALAVYVGLSVGLPPEAAPLRTWALRALQAEPDRIERRRDWALVELLTASPVDGSHDPADADTSPETATAIIDALVAATSEAPRATRDRFVQELAHAMLRLDAFPDHAVERVHARLTSDPATAAEELRLVQARVDLAAGRQLGADLVSGDPPRVRADPDVGGPWGPDPKSPVRNPDMRAALLSSQRALTAAKVCIARENTAVAQDLLVEALVEWPAATHARELLTSLITPASGRRLEDLLAVATRTLAAVPNRVLGVSLEGVQQAMGQVVSARERLARPLTIAIMGEFSAGKSTFVNALLGEPVAPMGVLPTTTTINVFRRGMGRDARVHYRDDRIRLVDGDQIQAFLHGLDDTEASRIRHVEIERSGERMGDAAVVDTPGLNALDEYHEQVAREFLDEADAVVWVFSATRSGAASEVGMLRELRDSGRQVLGILNKVDTLESAEQRELATYLKEQLGTVLVDVVPLEARQALDWRTSTASKGGDPFAKVDAALETHFLNRARELKRSLTTRRLIEALAAARSSCMEAIKTLEGRAGSSAPHPRTSADASTLLQQFATRLEPELLAVDDILLREALSLGVLETGKGMAKGPLDPLDAEYLGVCFRDAALAALARALVEVAADDRAASEVLDRAYVPWARGHLDGLIAGGFVSQTLTQHGAAVSGGEAAARAAFRVGLEPVLAAWIDHAKGLAYEIERAQRRADRSTSSVPRAEALRLRSAVVASIDALSHAAHEAMG